MLFVSFAKPLAMPGVSQLQPCQNIAGQFFQPGLEAPIKISPGSYGKI